MKRTTSCVAAAASLVLASCAPMTPRTPAAPFQCKASPCEVTITVPACEAISVNRDPLHVVGITKAEIVWKLSAPGYVFGPQGTGISLKQPSSEFSNPRRTDNEYRLSNANSARGRHEYNIVLKHGNQTCSWDPVIVNEP